MATLEEIRTEGRDALKERLGRAGMIRFLQQFETGNGDYASERHDWVDQVGFEEIRDLVRGRRPTRQRGGET